MTKEIMYNVNSVAIVLCLFAAILIAYEIAFRLGSKYQRNSDQEVKAQTNTVQAGILGLLALLLGFTFNMALQRYDDRTTAVISEANGIGTAMLRTKLLPSPFDSIAAKQLQDYTQLRIEISEIDLTEEKARKEINQRTDALINKIWDVSILAAHEDPRPVTTGYYITALNELIDARGERNAMLQKHVPEVILFLLFIVFIIGDGLMGYSSGLGLRRAYIPTVMFTALIVLIVFIIIDLDRPKRGIIKVSQASLIELQD